MIYNLDRTDIKNLLSGISCPPYETLEELQKRGLGQLYRRSFYDKWIWNLDDTKESDQNLFELYLRLKEK